MLKTGLFSSFLLLVSHSVLASEVNSVHIFHNDDNPVKIDRNLHYTVELTVHNMDTKAKTDKKLNEIVTARLKPGYENNLKDSYGTAFSEVLNGPEWGGIYTGLGQYAKATEHAIRYRIKKLPAIMINGKSIIYGISSLREGLEIYDRKARNL